MNSSGPRIDPWGTPKSKVTKLDFTFSIST